MVSTPLKNIRQDGNLPQVGVKIKNIWNHHLVLGWCYLEKTNKNLKERKKTFRLFRFELLDGNKFFSVLLFQGIVGFTPIPTYPYGKSLYKPYIAGIYGLLSPDNPIWEHQLNTMGPTLLRVRPIVPWFFDFSLAAKYIHGIYGFLDARIHGTIVYLPT